MYTAAAIVFWSCAALIIYTYLIYPLVLMVLARRRRGLARPDQAADRFLPTVSVLIVAHNEESIIRERIENLLDIDYPRDKLELVVASDASRDRTCAIVREYSDQAVAVVELPSRAGKAAVLDSVIPALIGEIVVLSDANTMMDRDAIRRLIRWFSDPHVGIVCGKLVLTDPATGSNVDSLYWRYETFLKRCEAKLGGLLGANGGIYALRRSLFSGVRHDTIVDDFVIPLLAQVRTGCRLVYDETAVAREETPPEIAIEFRRRARIGAGDFQSITLLWPLLNPRRGAVAFTFFSHKLLRWLCPFFLLGLAAANVLLVNVGIYGVSLAVGIALCSAAIAGLHLQLPSATGRAIRLAAMFAAMNAALLVGFFRWATGHQPGAWERTVR
jgi:cellulose synthase/poly-beta-1,6-N-acetylglucosamine synthase-like glycosyltransferase